MLPLKRYFLMAKIFLHKGGYKRAAYLKKKGYFGSQGEHCFFQPWNFGTNPKLIHFGNNVHIASGVTFVNHDVTSYMFSYQDKAEYKVRRGTTVIGDNVFVGAESILLYDVKIGSNVIIGAGSVVSKDIPDNTVAAGVPCRPIGDYFEYKNKIINKS